MGAPNCQTTGIDANNAEALPGLADSFFCTGALRFARLSLISNSKRTWHPAYHMLAQNGIWVQPGISLQFRNIMPSNPSFVFVSFA